MYNSNITASDLINSITNEADISVSVPVSFLIRTINTVEQFIYTEILNEYVSTTFNYDELADENAIDLESLVIPANVQTPLFDDVIKVFADGDEIERAGAVAAYEFQDKNLYYNKYDGKITLSLAMMPLEVTVIHRLKPMLKTEENASNTYIALPTEYVELMCAKLRGEMYKLVNEDALSAKWLAEYNNQIENFKVWAATRTARFGG